ncbi:MAG: aldose epimerase [Microcystaceae cyanobacterium]
MLFKVALKNAQYQTYLLSDETALAEAEVVPERGGIITRWRIQGQDILYLDEERFKNADLSIRGGIPILFPICGDLPESTYIYQNKTYKLKQHGFARNLPWQVVAQNTEDSASLTLVLESDDTTRDVYPFEFRLTFRYKLQGNSLYLYKTHTNLSETVMPFASGLHTYFSVSDKTQLTFDIPSSQYQEKGSPQVFPFDGSFDFEKDEIDVAFKELTSQTASFSDLKRKLTINTHYSDHYSTLVFWTVKGKDYICIEPWTAPRNSLNTGEKQLYLDPGESLETVVTLSAIAEKANS